MPKFIKVAEPRLPFTEDEISASGATPSYSFLWSNGETSSIISSLLPGFYTVDVSDDNGCFLTDTAEILAGSNPELNVIVQNVSCFGANDGMMFTSADLVHLLTALVQMVEIHLFLLALLLGRVVKLFTI